MKRNVSILVAAILVFAMTTAAFAGSHGGRRHSNASSHYYGDGHSYHGNYDHYYGDRHSYHTQNGYIYHKGKIHR